jgi:hypothetical protein
MNAELVAVRVKDDRTLAPRRIERLKGELHLVMSEMLHRAVEILHLEREVRAIGRWFEERTIPDGERVRTNFIL